MKSLSSLWIPKAFPFPLIYGRNTGQKCPANPQTGMSALQEKYHWSGTPAVTFASHAASCTPAGSALNGTAGLSLPQV